MTQPDPSAAAPSTPPPPAPAEPPPNPAVQRCCAVYRQALTAGGGPKVSAAVDAAINAYKVALPQISTRASIRDFIACITQGMVLGVFWNDQGPKLIGAAKAALAALPREPAPLGPHMARPAGRPRMSGPTPLPEN